MHAPGLLSTIQIAATLVFALPLGLFGLNLVADGRPLGAAFLVLAVLMVVLPHYLWSPPSPKDMIGRAVGRFADDEQE